MRGLTGRWPLLIGGLGIGVAEIIYYLWYQKPVNITFAPAGLIAALEERFIPQHLLYGRFFAPELNPVFVGLVAAAFVAALTQRRRHRVVYPLPVLAVSFLGGMLVGFGAVLAEGDTLYHLVGGVALMQVSSLFMAAFAIPFVFITLELMSVLGVAGFFRLDAGSAAPDGRVSRLVPELIGFAAAAILVAAAALAGTGGPAPIAVGAIVGVVIARSGLGVEWALLTPDCAASSPRFLTQLGLPETTVRTLRTVGALRGWLMAIFMFGTGGLVYWLVRGLPVDPGQAIADGGGLHIGHVAGAPLLAIGSVMMIGCEFRTYARLGLGYTSALAAFPGLLAGYLPAAAWGTSIRDWTHSNMIALTSWLPDYFPSSMRLALWAIFLAVVLAGLLLLSSRARNS